MTDQGNMSMRGRIDPESLKGLDAALTLTGPGGVGAIADLAARRAKVAEMMAATREGPSSEQLCVVDHVTIAGPGGELRIRLYRPVGAGSNPPGMLFIHGGGMILGNLDLEDSVAQQVAVASGAITASVDYRLAPEAPFPAAIEDCFAALTWFAAAATELGFDPRRLVVYGGSAGGGLAVATALVARDRGFAGIHFVMAPYPMLDCRNQTPSSRQIVDVGVWDRAGNIEAWAHYLGGTVQVEHVSPYASPSLAEDLSNLPPMFFDVGDVDLFRDEVVDFALRSVQAGNVVELHLYPGSYHSSEIFAPEAELSETIWQTRFRALERALRD